MIMDIEVFDFNIEQSEVSGGVNLKVRGTAQGRHRPRRLPVSVYVGKFNFAKPVYYKRPVAFAPKKDNRCQVGVESLWTILVTLLIPPEKNYISHFFHSHMQKMRTSPMHRINFT
jgi:hypothetical protein